MNRQEAVRTLVLAGREDEVKAAIDGRAEWAQADYKELRSNDSWSEDYKLQRIKETWDEHKEALADELVKLAGSSVRDDRVDASGVFGVDGIPGDKTALIIALRDAGDRVSQIDSQDDLMEMLNRATRIGDEVMARAVADKAMEWRYNKVLEKFIDDRPNLADPVKRIWDAKDREEDSQIATWSAAILTGNLRPAEF